MHRFGFLNSFRDDRKDFSLSEILLNGEVENVCVWGGGAIR